MKLHVRPACPGDLQGLLRLYVQLSPENAATSPVRAAAGLREVLARTDIALLVAEVNGDVAGTVMLVVVPNLTYDARPWIQLENMVVDERARRAGIGEALIEAASRLARERNAYKIQLQSAEDRAGAHAFYRSMGFKASSLGFRRYFE